MVECDETFYQRRFASVRRTDKYLGESSAACGAYYVGDMVECDETFYQRRFASVRRMDKYFGESSAACGAYYVGDMVECGQQTCTEEKMSWKKELERGLKDGTPICLGYIPVAFTFGFIAVSGGLPVWAAFLISLTNLTSAGQFAGTNLILLGAGYVEIGLTTFVINIRYMLMSLSLTQKIEETMGTLKRMLFGFAVTDEIFVVASLKPGTLRAVYLFGLILPPIAGWNLGTVLGACISSVLPAPLQNAMGIALYGMFIALIVPAARDSIHVLVIILIAVSVNCMLKYIPVFSFVSSGFRIILSTMAGAGCGAALFPKDDTEYVTSKVE